MSAHQRVIAGLPATLGWSAIDATGEPADPGAVTVTVTRADGTTITGLPAVAEIGVAPRTVALTSTDTARLDQLTCDWTVNGTVVATTVADVAAGVWFSNAELRAAETALAAAVSFTPDLIRVAREQVEANIEQWCRQAFVLCFSVDMLPATAGALYLTASNVRRIRFAHLLNEDGTVRSTLTAGELAALTISTDDGVVRSGGWTDGVRVRVGYEHGQNAPPPGLKAAAMRLCREVLAKGKGGGLPENAISYSSTELGWSAVLVTPGVRGAHTTIPDVNEQIDANTFTIAMLR